MECYDAIYGNNYYDFIVKNNAYLPPVGEGVCTLDGGQQFTILFASSALYPPMSISNYSYNAIPNCYVPLATDALEDSGILQVRDTPSLKLTGKDVLIGFLDTGIYPFDPAFLDASEQSRVVAVWDQRRPSDGTFSNEVLEEIPEEFTSVDYGRVYGSDTLVDYMPGEMADHGSFVAKIAAGNEEVETSGAAPEADIAMVHLKDAKEYLKDYYFIPRERLCFQENDIMMGLHFLNELALRRGQSLVVCMSVGCYMGSHSGNSPLGQYVNDLAVLYRRCLVCATGNEAASRRHFFGRVEQDSYLDVEVVVEEGTCGFVLEQWAKLPSTFSIALISPVGEVLPQISIQLLKSQEFVFPLAGSKVRVDYSMPEAVSGNQLIYYRFENPAVGVWRIRVFSAEVIENEFHMYLAPLNLQCGEVYFLMSNPDVTIADPANAGRVLTVGGYQQRTDALYLESGRGYTIDGQRKPDLVAPAYEIEGRSATTAEVAITSGAAAMYMEWCNRNMDYRVNTTQVKSFLIRGARPLAGGGVPNKQVGYGALDLYASFQK